MKRELWVETADMDGDDSASAGPDSDSRHLALEGETANLVSSRLESTDGVAHAPALDIDFPCRLVPSRTEGHFHLYIDKPMSWERYERLLRVLGAVGILEPGYVGASIARKQTFLRVPKEDS